mgnify:CR=1 FL=1
MELTGFGFGFEVEAYCTGYADVFVGDGEGYLYQYWETDGKLVPVRTLATNPDIEQCVVGPRYVYFLDPVVGILAYDRNPETDPVMIPVYLAPPAGVGRFRPVGLSVAGQRLQLAGEMGESDEIPLHPGKSSTVNRVRADVETEATHRRGDAADDSVVLPEVIAGERVSGAWILGTDKQHGLRVYDLEGRQLNVLPVGKLNNIDALPLDTGGYLVAASNRTSPSIDLFQANPATDVLERLMPVPLDFEEPYGLCMAEIEGEPNVFVGDKTGVVERWRIDGEHRGERIGRFRFDSLTEGCVVDREDLTLYVGEEDVGIWSVDLRSGERMPFDQIDNGWLVADVEGLDIYHGDGYRYLLASSQGDDSFVVYELPAGRPLLKFAVAEDRVAGIDGVSETDGIAVASQALEGFPGGVLVLQDGHNVAPADNQNFKIVDWRRIEALLAAQGSAGTGRRDNR